MAKKITKAIILRTARLNAARSYKGKGRSWRDPERQKKLLKSRRLDVKAYRQEKLAHYPKGRGRKK